jgi:hypothetical protein
VLSTLPPISLFLSCLLPTSVACSRIIDKTNCHVSKVELKMQRKISSIQQRDPISLWNWVTHKPESKAMTF